MSPEEKAEWRHRYEERVGIMIDSKVPVGIAEELAKDVCRRWLERERRDNDKEARHGK